MPRPQARQLVWTSIVRLAVQSGSTVSVLLINGVFGQASVALYSVAFAAISLISKLLMFGWYLIVPVVLAVVALAMK